MARNVVIIGGNGFLGSKFRTLVEAHERTNHQIFFPKRHSFDLADIFSLRRMFAEIQPEIVINCAGFREVDLAELMREEAYLANVFCVRNLAQVCEENGSKLVHFSTHGVFDGNKIGPYLESDAASPVHYYGFTKLQGEKEAAAVLSKERLLILRISWPYGAGCNNFISKILMLAKSSKSVRVVADEWGVPNPADLLAERTLMIMREATGLLHLTCTGFCSRYELISLMVKSLRISCDVIPVSSAEFPVKIPRPKNIAIATEKSDWVKQLAMPDWEKAWGQYVGRGEVFWY